MKDYIVYVSIIALVIAFAGIVLFNFRRALRNSRLDPSMAREEYSRRYCSDAYEAGRRERYKEALKQTENTEGGKEYDFMV